MNKYITVLTLALSAAMSLSTLADSYSVQLTPNHVNGRYEPNQVVGFTLASRTDSPIADGQKFRVTWYAGSEKREEKVYTYDSVDPKLRYRVTETGLYRLRAMPLKGDGSNAVNEWEAAGCGVLCDFANISKPMTGDFFPSDFDSWWDGEVAAQQAKTFKEGKLDMSKVVMTPYDFQGCSASRKAELQGHDWYMDALSKTDNYDVRIPAAGTNWVAGGLSMPKDHTKKYPAVIYFYGVGWDGACEIDPVGARDTPAIYFHVNAHGLPEGANWDEDYQNMQAWIKAYAAQRDDWGREYQQIGKGEGRDNFYYRHVFLRAAQAVEFIKAIPEWDGTTLIVSGRSQGSAQSVAAAALAEGVTHLYLGISAMCDFTGPANTPKREYSWPFNNRYPVHPESDYFDCVNFAHRITGKKIGMVFGCSDDPCPATGPASLYNTFPDSNTKDFKTVGAMDHDGAWAYDELQPRIIAALKGQTDPGFTEEPNPSDVEETLDDALLDELSFKNGDTIAFLGDSITQAGSYDDGYIRLFEKAILNLGIEQYTFFERGVGGNTSADMLARVDNDVVAYHPTWTTYSAGVNDICYSGKTQTLDQYKANVTATFDKLDACGTKVIVFTTTPISEQTGESALDPYVTWLRSEANSRGYRIAEMNTAMKAELTARGATGSDPWKLTTDGIHLNADGNKIMAWELLKAFGIDASHKDEIYGIFASGDPVATPYPKAVWREGTKTLTFYYNTHSYANDADVTAEYAIGADGSKTWDDVLPDVEHAAFDLSFVYFMPTDCTAWFWKASKLKDIDRLDYLNTVNCQSTGQMFGDCGSLTNLNLGFFNTAKVVTMYQMFRNLSSITELDLSSFDTSNVQSFWQMFLGDSSLKRIIVSDKFVTTKVTDGTEMFTGCTSLAGENGTTFDPAKDTSAMAHVDVAGNPGYLTLVGTMPDDPQGDDPQGDDPQGGDPVVSGQLDHWKYDGGSSMTDGEWTFKVQMRYDKIDGSIYPIWVEGCTGYPETPTTLDFSKDVVYEADRSLKFAITKIEPGFNGSTAGQSVKVLKLPTHGYPFNIGDRYTVIEGFKNCHNLESVVPFLPDSCIAIGGGTFSGCEKLASPLVWRGGSGMNPTSESSLWQLFENTAIPSADLSDASLPVIDRMMFSGCTALKSVKLPKTMTELTGGVNPFNGCTALELVEFNSVPSSLSGFNGCTALKEVRFNHTAPSGPNAIDPLIYNAISTEYQYIATYLVLDSDESDKLEIWKNYATGNVINSSDSTWAASCAGDANLSKRRPLLLYAAKSVSLAAGENGSFTADRPGTFVISRGEGDSLSGMVMVNYTISGGTARSGIHFEPLSGTASIPSGLKTGVIEVTPKYFGSVGTETLTLKLAAGDYEIIPGEDEATISLSTEALRSVSIAKGVDAEANSGQVGTFIIARGAGDALGGSITVNYTIDYSSTAQPDVHYKALSGVATIPPGEREGVIEVTPKYFGYVGTETLKLKLAAGEYEIGTDEASISISTKNLRSVSIAKGEDADEGSGTVGYFILSRGEGEQTAVPLEVSLSVGGTAKAGQTYRPISSVATIPAGEKSTKVKVVPFDDPSVTEDKTVEVTILPGAYGIGTALATANIRNGATYGGWKFVDASHISDGKWTFTVARRYYEVFADGVHELWIQECTAWPTEVSTLDFGKAFHNFYDSTYYMIRRLEFEFGGNAATSVAQPAGVVLGALVLPDDDGYPFSIGGSCFANCPNLVSITPFLPRSCDSLARDTFSFLPSLKETDLYFYGSDFGNNEGCWGIIQNDTSITNVDLSASTVTVLRRDCFKNCTSLKTVTLPPTIQEFGAPYNSTDPGLYNRSPFAEIGGVKLVFTGGALPLMTCNDGNVSAIEFTTPVVELSDNAFYGYFNPYGETLLTSITFVGEPPAKIGTGIFGGEKGNFKEKSITVFVPNASCAAWRGIADGKVLTKEEGGTWTSGSTQLLVTYGESRQGLAIYGGMDALSSQPALSAAVSAVPLLGGAADSWFDAQIASYEDWPTDGTPVEVTGQGEWTGTDNASLLRGEASRLKAETDGRLLVFSPSRQKTVEDGDLAYDVSVRLTAMKELPADSPQSAVAILALASADGGTLTYCAYAKDPDGGANVWTPLAGAVPDVEKDVCIRILLRKDGDRTLAQYLVDGVALTLGGEDWVEVVPPAEMSGGVAFSGIGEIAALSATVESAAPVVMRTLTVPAIDHVASVRVSVAGKIVEPDAEGNYLVEQGAVVTVSFAPDSGWALDVPKMTFVVRDDMELPAEGRPNAINVAEAITINEIMASNGSSLATKGGVTGIDWIELRNHGDEPVDLSDWYMGNDPTAAAKDWEKKFKIQGECVVPAHGYKIVWFDGDKVCRDWAADEAHVTANISTTAGKHTVFLSRTADPKDIVQQIKVPGMMKDVSYGLGHLERTLLGTKDAAQYRVGEGEWKAVRGPVGMSAGVAEGAGFTVTSYKLDRQLTSVDAALSAIRDQAWTDGTQPSEETGVRTIAYRSSGQSVDFPAAGYADFPVETGDLAMVVRGTVVIPESGLWTFSVGSDDGFRLTLANGASSYSMEYAGTRGYGQTYSAFNMDAGAYNLELVYFDRNGGAALDLSVAKGDYTTEESGEFNTTDFHLIGTAECPVAFGGALAAFISADVGDEMIGKASTLDWTASFAVKADDLPTAADSVQLKVRYADGLVAKLNGTEIARTEVAARTADETLAYVAFEIDPALVQAENTLEISVTNDRIDDTELYLEVQVTMQKAEDDFVYFREPTPLAENTAHGYGPMTPKVAFSEKHGYKTEPFELALSCADAPYAPIYYTLDGTAPTEKSTLYTGPITVSQTTCVRAAVPQDNTILQYDCAATYIFLDDVLANQRSGVVPEGFPRDGEVNGHAMRYGLSRAAMEADPERLRRGFENISTFSIVIDPKNLFDKASGIYVNPSGDGKAWERQMMLEGIDPTGDDDGFSIPAGIRIRGAASRKEDHAKHSFRFFFRGEYGEGSLKYRLFGDESNVDEFDKVDLRCSQNYSWANEDSNSETFIHECFSRDSQGALGEHYTKSRYYHLFINGQYWGLYQTQERGDEDFAEAYNGGVSANYDVIKTSQPGYVTGASEGTEEAWKALWDLIVNQPDGPQNYRRAMGLNPDGTRNKAYPVYLNPTNLITYMLISHYVCDCDTPISLNGHPNNIYALRDRVDGDSKSDGFFFLRHDAEHSMGLRDEAYASADPTVYGTDYVDPNGSPAYCGPTFLTYDRKFSPAELYWKLGQNDEFRRTIGDLFYRHFVKAGGAMTAPVAKARFGKRMDEITDAIVAEAARWSKDPNAPRSHGDWEKACKVCLDFIDQRLPHMIAQYQNRGWYPKTAAAEAVDGQGQALADGATVAAEDAVHLASPSGGTVYYTTDGSDPARSDGTVSPDAVAYAEGIPVPAEGLRLTMRVLSSDGKEWSPVDSVSLKGEMPKSTPAEALRLAAVCSSTQDGDGDGSEFIVLTNVSEGAVSLANVKLVAWNSAKKTEADASLTITFTEATEILPGRSLTLDKATWFGAKGKLTNSEVGLKIYANDVCIQEARVNADWWNGACDKTGAYFIALEFGAEVKEESQWRPSLSPAPKYPEVIAEVAETNEAIRTWIEALYATEGGKAAIDGFTGTTEALRDCYLVDIPPEAEPEIKVEIPSILIGADGKVTVGGDLSVHGVKQTKTVNGTIRLYHASTLEALPTTKEVFDLGSEFPIPEAMDPLDVGNASEQFFRLKVE